MEKRPEEQIHSLGMDVPKGKFGTSYTPKVPNHDLGLGGSTFSCLMPPKFTL